jgi:hypothetical protein
MLTLFKIGTKVRVGEGEGTITCIALYANDHVRYEVAWWQSGTRHSQYLEECEIEPLTEETLQIGFGE